MSSQTPRSVLAALGTVQFLFAIHYIASKWLLTQIPPPAWAALRVGGAAVVLLLLARLRGVRWSLDRSEILRLGGLSVFGIILNQIFFAEGLSRTVPSHSALINASIPVNTLLIAVLLRRESFSRRKGLALTAALGGVLTLLSEKGFDWSSPTLRGDLLCLANATSFSIFLVLSRPIMQRHSAWITTPVLFVVGSIGVTAYGLPELRELAWSEVSGLAWLVATGIIVGPTVGSYGLNNWVLGRAEASTVALFIYLQFILAAPLSWAILGEELSWRLIPAGLLVFTGLIIAVSGQKKRAALADGPLHSQSAAVD
jgi:drug/metabolite transporter (DMT)-like permease